MNMIELSKTITNRTSIRDGREKIATDALIKHSLTLPYATLHIDGVELVKPGTADMYAVFTFKELPTSFWNGCKIATEIAALWLEHFHGDALALMEQLDAEHIGFKLSTQVSKQGRPYTAVQVVSQY